MEWEKLETLARSDNYPYHIAFHFYLSHDKARRDFLLAFIKNHHKHVVDNLTTNDDLSYSDVLKRLRELDDVENAWWILKHNTSIRFPRPTKVPT